MKNNMSLAIIFAIAFLFLPGCEKKEVDTRSELFITSVPDIAKVRVNDKEIGLTPLRIKLPPDVYVFQLEKEGFKTHFKKIACEASKDQNIEVNLLPVTSSVMISSTPPGAIIQMGGVQLGETPLIIHDNNPGKHSASISKPAFVTQEISWNVEDARPQEVSATLSSNVGTLAFESDPSEADVIVDGKFIGRTPLSEKFEQGEKNIKIQKQGYTVFEQIVPVARDQERSVSANLTIMPGKLIVKSNPSGAAIYINDELARETPAEIANLKPGNYVVRVEKPSFDPETREVTVNPGRETEITVNMTTNLGGIDLAVNPPGVTIFLDGKKLGATIADQNKSISRIFEIRGVSSGKHNVVLSHNRAIPNEKTFSVTVAKGEIARPKQVTMWIADTYIKLKNGREMNGKLRQENEDVIMFDPEPTIHLQYRRDEIEILKKMVLD